MTFQCGDSDGKFIVVEESGHNIQRERPEVVVKAIREIIK